MNLNTRIRVSRRRAELTQAELAARLGVGRSAVANWECAGNVQPSSHHLMAIAIATGVSHEWLATGRGMPALDLDHQDTALDAELVEDPVERQMLRGFRAASPSIQQALLQIAEAQLPSASRRPHRSA